MSDQRENNTARALFAEERHLQILELLQEKTKLYVAELCEQFSVSPATIRNDLRDLEAAGKLKRTHGGAIPAEKMAFEPNTHAKAVANRATKQRLAAHAVSLIEDNDTIALDSGTTMMEIAICLAQRKALTVLTNDVHIAVHLERNPQITVVLIGGILRPGFGCTVGPIATATLSTFNVDKVFLGANAFSVEKGFTTPDLQMAEIKKALIHGASERIVVCDSSKLGRVSFVEFAAINEIDRLITDKNVSPKLAAHLREHHENLELIMV